MRNARLTVIALFMLLLWAPLAAAVLSPRFPTFWHNVLESPMSFDSEREALRRSTPLWDSAVGVYNRTLYALGTTNNRALAVAGRDGWLFLGDLFQANFSQAIGRWHLDPAHRGRWTSALRAQEQWLAARNIGYAFLVSPAKWSIHPEKLPDWAAPASETPFDQLLAERPIARMPDVRQALRAAGSRAATYSPLNSHWTDYGAWAAWREFSLRLREASGTWGEVPVPETGATPVDDSHNEFAGMLSLHIENPWTGFVPAVPFADYEVERDDGTRVRMPGSTQTDLLDLPRITLNPAAPNPRTILVMRDSSGNSLSLFIQAAFAKTIQIDHALTDSTKTPDMQALVEKHRPDLVLWIVTERYLAAEPPAVHP